MCRRLFSRELRIKSIMFLAIFVIAVSVIGSQELFAIPSDVGFYALNSFPGGSKSLEPLIAKWWNFRFSQDPNSSTNWPPCLRGESGVIGDNQSVIFLGDPASANPTNVNARDQKCEISPNQLLYLVIYAGECSSGENTNFNTPAGWLGCARESNAGVKMNAKVDGIDVSSHIVVQNSTQPFTLVIPPDNAFGYQDKIGNWTSMAQMYYLLFKPLPIGDHSIEVTASRESNGEIIEDDHAKWNIKVVP